jgi:multimeric flavodoxin WrbA
LKTKIEHIEEYDVVFLGFPTWDMQLPPPVKSFLHQYSLKGKTVIPFNTNGGYGEGSSFQTVRELCPKSSILKGFSIRGGSERDGEYLAIKGARAEEARKNINNWLAEIGMLN